MTYYRRFVDLFLPTFRGTMETIATQDEPAQGIEKKKEMEEKTERETERERKRERETGKRRKEKERQRGSFFHDEKTVSPIVDRYPSWNNRDNEKATQPKSFVLFSLFFYDSAVTEAPRFSLSFSLFLFLVSAFISPSPSPAKSPGHPFVYPSLMVFILVCDQTDSLPIALHKNRKESFNFLHRFPSVFLLFEILVQRWIRLTVEWRILDPNKMANIPNTECIG